MAHSPFPNVKVEGFQMSDYAIKNKSVSKAQQHKRRFRMKGQRKAGDAASTHAVDYG
jgi:hypothetical protein